MVDLPSSQHIEVRDSEYFLTGTRISLASIACAVTRGEALEEILADFPAIESSPRLQGALDYIRAHPKEIEAYLAIMASRWEDARKLNPPDVVERMRRFRNEKARKSA